MNVYYKEAGVLVFDGIMRDMGNWTIIQSRPGSSEVQERSIRLLCFGPARMRRLVRPGNQGRHDKLNEMYMT